MKHSNTARIIAVIIAVVMFGGSAAIAITRAFIQDDSVPTSQASENAASSESSQPSEDSSEQLSSNTDDEQAAGSFTFMDMYEANNTGAILESHDSVKTTVHLYFPAGTNGSSEASEFEYTRFASKDEDGEYYYHYIDTDGQEESIQRDNIFMTDDGESIRFQVAYDPEFETDVIPYITSGNPYYLEPTEEVRSCTLSNNRYYLETGIDMAQDEYYANNWGYTEGVADCYYTILADSLIIESISLYYNDELMMETSVDLDGEDVASPMMDKVNASENSKQITVYYDYGGDSEKAYVYQVPQIAAFYYSQPEGFTMYVDPEGTLTMADADPSDSRLTADQVSLYLIRTEQTESESGE